ncbi:unnamed protein product [Sphagnum tenellum]
MKSDVPLDYAIFHLTPTRTRCELLVASGKEKERLATGLIKPFLTHLKAVEDQISNGCCSSSSITLQPPPSTTNTFGDTNANASKKKDPPPPPPHDSPWFTKGTVERFVRFVSTPEVLEFVSSVEDELTQIEEAISLRAMESASPSSWGSRHSSLDGGGMDVLEAPESTKRQVACAMDARRLVLHKEQGIAFTRAAAAGFDVQHMAHLLAFADCFGATRLRDACVKFMAVCKKRQEACNYIEEMESEAMNSERLCLPVSARSDGSLVRHSRGQYADRQSEIHGNLRDPEASINENDISSRSHCRLFNDGQAFVGRLSAERTTGKDVQAGGILECSLSKKQDDKEDDLCKEAPCRSLSVKDAISLFEVKRVDVTEEFKKKHPRQQEPCRVSSTGTPRTSLSSSSVFEKPVLRRWSQIAAGNNSDCSHIETEQQSKDLCRSSPEDSCMQYDTTMVKILPEPHQSTESFHPGVIKVVVSEASTIAPGMHRGEFSRMSVDSVLPPDSLAKYAAARSALRCSSGPENDSSFYQEAHVEEEKDFVAFVESEGQKTRTVAKDQELVQPALPSFVLDASNTAVASQAASAEDNSSNQLRTGIQQEVELPDGDQHSSLLKESKFSTSENSPSIPPASVPDDGSLALNTAANQKSVSEFHHEENNGDVKHVVGVVKGETNSPQEPKGRFYEHYRERRDAKLREEPGSKRAEREAKLKAMHEVLEKRKEEMVACNNNNSKMVPEKLHSAASVDTQLHAEKLHNFKPELAIGRKSKLSSPKQNVVHKLSSPQKFFPGSSPHVNMNVMSPASAAVPGAPKLSSHAASQRWSATALVNSTTSGEILLSHSSGPCVAELRKENTKPLAVRSSTLHERKLVNKTISGTVLRSSTAPLEANRSQPAAVVSFNVYEDKKSRNSSMRRSLSLVSADLLQEAPPTVSQTPALKISKYLMVEQNNMTNKPMKHMAAAYCQAVTPDAKPFLRKGRGIGPGAGAAETDQVSPVSFEVHTEDYSCANLHMPASCTGSSQEVEVEPQLLEASSHEEVSSIYTSPAALDETYKKSSSPWIHEFSQANNPPSNSSPSRSSTSCVPISPPEALVVNIVAEKVSLESPPCIQSSPPHLPLFASSSSPRTTPFYERESCHAPCVLAAATALPPSGVNDGDDEVPHSAARSRRKWGCAEKMQPPIIIMSKESPKGIRKLLKFGRKSRNSGCSFPSSTANDWHETASTTTTTASDAEDADLELNNRMSFSNLTKRLERSWKNGGPQLLLHKGGRSVSAVRESSSSSSTAADSTAARSSNHAPRSFFSLSTFRSRSNESKSRS